MATKKLKIGNVPNLRFREFEGEWEMKKLEDVCVTIGDGLHGTPEYSQHTGYYFINGNNLVGGQVVISDSTKEVGYNDWLKNRKKITDNTLFLSINGTIGNVARFNNENVMLGKSVAYLDFKINSNFYYQLLKSNKIQNHFYSELTGTTIKNLSLKTIRETEIAYPSILEQEKIASFLSLIDNRIHTQNKIILELESLIKGLIEDLFAQRLRFKDDKGSPFPEWKVERLGEIYSFKVTNSFSRENLNYDNGTIKNIHYGDIHTKFKTLFDITKESVPFINPEMPTNKISEDNYCKEGDLILADASEDLNDVGKSIELVNLNNERLLSGLHTILARPGLKMLSIGFGGYLFKSNFIRTKIQKEAQGSKVLSISTSRLSNIIISFPSIREQTLITNFLSSIDEKIDVEKTLLQQLENQKKYLLSNLFA